MFTDSSARSHQVTASRLRTSYQAYTANADSWFDGTVASVDTRLARSTKLLHAARTAAGTHGLGRGYLTVVADLEADRTALTALRHDLLTAASDREAGKHDTDPERPWKNTMADEPYFDLQETPEFAELALDGDYKGKHRANLSPQGRRFVELEAAKFVAANTDAGRDEIKIRARNFALLHASTRPRHEAEAVSRAFTARCLDLVSRRPAPRVAAVAAPQPPVDFDSALLYLS